MRKIGGNMRKVCIISKGKADLPHVRIEINFASAILSKTEQGSTLLTENNLIGVT